MTSPLAQPHTRRLPTLVAAALVVAGLFAAAPAFGDRTQEHRGASMLTVAAVAPNIARCGAFPPNVEVQFTGQGTDTGGGPFTSAASACQNVITNEVFDLISVDTYWTGDSITILSEPFFLVPNPTTCLATNPSPVKYSLPGGTGIFANAIGSGTYHIYVTDPVCSGVTLPAQVAFEGKIKL
jgi:hypothetical protein